MRWEKILAACICIYLAVSLPLYILNQQAVKQCQPACEAAGFDIVISATNQGQKTECWCLDSIARKEKTITLG